MGTCVSKCCFASPAPSTAPSISDPESPHGKPVISSEYHHSITTAPPPNDTFSDIPKTLSKFQIHPSPPTPSSSSSSISTATTTASASSTSTSYSSTSQANHFSDLKPPPLKKKSFSNEFLLSCVENSNIVILDPTKGTKEKTIEAQISQFSEIPITPSQYLSVATRGATTTTTSALRQRTNINPNTSMRADLSNNAKRARSVSPASRTGRKIIRPDPGSWTSVNSTVARPRTADTRPPQWIRPINSQRGSSVGLTGPVSRPVSTIKRDLKGPTMEKEANVPQIEDGEVVSRERVKTPPLVEDLNNPLIAMDCFIFL